MTNSNINHLVYFIHDFEINKSLYIKFFEYIGHTLIWENENFFCINANAISIYFGNATTKIKNDRDSNGLNHIAFSVNSKNVITNIIDNFLKPNNIELLFGTPKSRPEFSEDDSDYYQIMFELPGDILFEIVSFDK